MSGEVIDFLARRTVAVEPQPRPTAPACVGYVAVQLQTANGGRMWTLMPVATRDAAGEPLHVLVRPELVIPFKALAGVVHTLPIRQDSFDPGVLDLWCWVFHASIDALKEALLPHLVCVGSDGLTPPGEAS